MRRLNCLFLGSLPGMPASPPSRLIDSIPGLEFYDAVRTLRVAMMLQDVSAGFGMRISPMFTGAFTRVDLMAFMTSGMLARGMAQSVRTLTRGKSPPSTMMLLAMVLIGLMSSCSTQAGPFLHV